MTTALVADVAPDCPKCKRPREVFSTYGAANDLALCPHCLGIDSPPIIVRRKPDRRSDGVKIPVSTAE